MPDAKRSIRCLQGTCPFPLFSLWNPAWVFLHLLLGLCVGGLLHYSLMIQKRIRMLSQSTCIPAHEICSYYHTAAVGCVGHRPLMVLISRSHSHLLYSRLEKPVAVELPASEFLLPK